MKKIKKPPTDVLAGYTNTYYVKIPFLNLCIRVSEAWFKAYWNLGCGTCKVRMTRNDYELPTARFCNYLDFDDEDED